MAQQKKTDQGGNEIEVEEKAEKIAGWFGLFSAAAGLLSKTDKLEPTSQNAIVTIMFSYLAIYILHDIYDACYYKYGITGKWYSSWKWSVILSVLAMIVLVSWFGAYWLQRPLGPTHLGPLLDERASFWIILLGSFYMYLYSLYDLWDAYHFEYKGWEYTMRTAVISLIVVIVLGFLSYRPALRGEKQPVAPAGPAAKSV